MQTPTALWEYPISRPIVSAVWKMRRWGLKAYMMDREYI